jgi:glycosyltransferase involved in cell wall biosynthesis
VTAKLTVMQVLPELEVGGVEHGTLEIAGALVAAGHRAIVVSGGGRLVEKLQACGAEHVELAVGAKRLSSLAHIHALAHIYQTFNVDIVHARSRLPAWLAWLARRRLAVQQRPAWVTTVHGPYTVNRYSRIMVSGEVVIAISEFIRDYIRNSYPGYADARIELIPRGVDADHFQHGYQPPSPWRDAWHAQYPELAGKILLTFPGRLTRWKGQLDFIALLAGLRHRGLNVHGLVVGAAHPRKPHFANELKRAAASAGVEGAITFLGNRTDLREIFAISALAFSLATAPEAFGRTTLEALSIGTPVIGYDHGGTGEILATLFPAGRVAVGDVSAAIERSVALLGSEPHVPANAHYTVAVMQQRTLAVYAGLKRG